MATSGEMREMSDKAKSIMASLPLPIIKRLPVEPGRWKEGDPDPEPSEAEQRELLAIVKNGAEVMPLPRPKPAPIVLEAARLDNVSQFPAPEAPAPR